MISKTTTRFWAGAALSALLAGCATVESPAPRAFTPSPERLKAHMDVLAADTLGGREAGTPGYDQAAAYVAGEFRKLELKPAGGRGAYLQPVPLISFRTAESGNSLVLRRADGTAVPLAAGTDWAPGAAPIAEVRLDAPLIFAGHGVVRPGRDDYAGLDARGKVVVLMGGVPEGLNTEEQAHFRSGTTKRALAAAQGAVGVLFLESPAERARRPFRAMPGRGMSWRGADGLGFQNGAPSLGTLSLEGAAKLFGGAPQTWAAIAAKGGEPPRFALPGRLAATVRSELSPLQSSNVAGLIEGERTDEIIVLSAHLDGVGTHDPEPAEGAAKPAGPVDRIHNGAMDNASGVATLLEVARGFQESGRKPRRSVMLLAVTAEEKGLVGADYFARNPTVPKAALVGNVNLDMPILSYDFTDVVAFGAERSSIGEAVARAAPRAGVKLVPDHRPQMNLFTRSDHYRFVEQGVPSVFLMTGPGNGGDEAWDRFFAERYHKPTDDMGQPINFTAAARFAQVNYQIARELADAPERPKWKADDFFGGVFGTPASRAAAASTGASAGGR
jgi:hypothetical protein